MYIVTELQTYADGTVGTIVNNYTSRAEAESRYHTILAAAAISNVPTHAAVLMTEEGFPLMHEAYHHAVAPVQDEAVEPPIDEGNT